MDRWKLIPESITGAYMLVNKKGEYVLYTDYEELHERTCELEMKYAKKSGDDFKRYKNCHEAQAEIDHLKAVVSGQARKIEQLTRAEHIRTKKARLDKGRANYSRGGKN